MSQFKEEKLIKIPKGLASASTSATETQNRPSNADESWDNWSDDEDDNDTHMEGGVRGEDDLLAEEGSGVASHEI